jgi:hypothetical protein
MILGSLHYWSLSNDKTNTAGSNEEETPCCDA